ncbi:ecdysteroid 22-kinase family protein [Photobacterium sp. SDRW27]|uniref:phosphotransferase n=1 Tax=Photobacterium obscurum TaxID=2829490 RepID=UPI0022440EB2|nr:phosphotransferase [Photobacterium obscurum]MCW8330962.1 ecdysteroid 22-kinase family protein [Photobacterium obscurum]
MTIPTDVLHKVAQAVGAESVAGTQLIQSLWGGYGELFRATLVGSGYPTVIVKHIKLPQPLHHPRGWNTVTSHQRKLDSYQVEVNWYQHFANHVSESHFSNQYYAQCPVPKCLFVEQQGDEILLILEDLKVLGFSEVHQQIELAQVKACLTWLANFHARHLAVSPDGLWECGTYWHLDTRPDELAALTDPALKSAAKKIDTVLKQCRFQTLVHGDAKLANFCFTPDGKHVAAVDFQYVGRGCGMKDVILLLSSCVPFDDCKAQVPGLLVHYFAELKQALTELQPHVIPEQVEQEWRPLYCVAWADFQRFVKGWCPDHWKINTYTEGLTQQALTQLEML